MGERRCTGIEYMRVHGYKCMCDDDDDDYAVSKYIHIERFTRGEVISCRIRKLTYIHIHTECFTGGGVIFVALAAART